MNHASDQGEEMVVFPFYAKEDKGYRSLVCGRWAVATNADYCKHSGNIHDIRFGHLVLWIKDLCSSELECLGLFQFQKKNIWRV